MNWKETIEAQIHWLYRSDCMGGDDFLDAVEQGQLHKASEQMQALLDVAVAADKALWLANFGAQQCTQCAEIKGIIKPVLDKLREVGDE